MDKHISYNVSYAYKYGATNALFLSALESLSLLNRSIDNSVSATREQIYLVSGLTDAEQENSENALSDIGVISIKGVKGTSEKKKYNVNYTKIFNTEIPEAHKESLVFAVSNKSSTSKKAKDKLKEELKKAVNVDNEVVKDAIYDWINSIVDSGKKTTVYGVIENVRLIKNYTSDVDEAVKIIRACTRNQWRDFQYGIKANKYGDSSAGMGKYSQIKSDGSDLIGEVF